jgi:TatD DNase family protein
MCEKLNNFQGFIDTHAHLNMLKKDVDISAIFAKGFSGIIDIGSKADDLPARLSAFSCFERVFFTAGIWPSADSIANRREYMAILEEDVASAPRDRLVAIGECGIDRHHNNKLANSDLAGERELFELQLDLAKKLNLPIVVHSRSSANETREILANYPDVRAVIHCFSYDIAQARLFLDMGCYLSFAGTLTYKNAHDLRSAFAFAPLGKILLETDSPYLAPQAFRGSLANPAMVTETYKVACGLLNVEIEDLKERIAKNASAVFSTEIRI